MHTGRSLLQYRLLAIELIAVAVCRLMREYLYLGLFRRLCSSIRAMSADDEAFRYHAFIAALFRLTDTQLVNISLQYSVTTAPHCSYWTITVESARQP